MKGRISQLVNDSIRDQFYGKAMECLKALREGCMRETESDLFNGFLTHVKGEYEGKRRTYNKLPLRILEVDFDRRST